MISKIGVDLDEEISAWLDARSGLLAGPAKLPGVGGPAAKALLALWVMSMSFASSVCGLPWWLSVALGLLASRPMTWFMRAWGWLSWRASKRSVVRIPWGRWWKAMSLQSQADSLRWVVVFAMLAAKASDRLGPRAHAWASGWAMRKWGALEIKMREAGASAWAIKCEASPDWGKAACHAWSVAIGLSWGGGESRALWKSRLAQARASWSPGRSCDDSEWVAGCWALTGADASWAPVSASSSAKRECQMGAWDPEGWSFAQAYGWGMERRSSAGELPSDKAWDALAMYRAQSERSGLIAEIESAQGAPDLPKAKPKRL